MGYGSEQIVLKRRRKWPRNTISLLSCLTSRGRLLALYLRFQAEKVKFMPIASGKAHKLYRLIC